MKPYYYKYCMVPQCKSNTNKTPNKLFIYVPHDMQIRKQWLQLARRADANNISINSSIYFCEDHFDLPNDMKNYMPCHLKGSVSKIILKRDCVPTKFACQTFRNPPTVDSCINSIPKNFIYKKLVSLKTAPGISGTINIKNKHLHPIYFVAKKSNIKQNIPNIILPINTTPKKEEKDCINSPKKITVKKRKEQRPTNCTTTIQSTENVNQYTPVQQTYQTRQIEKEHTYAIDLKNNESPCQSLLTLHMPEGMQLSHNDVKVEFEEMEPEAAEKMEDYQLFKVNKTDDDIDIEEHDVLNNINILPDLTRVKTEPEDESTHFMQEQNDYLYNDDTTDTASETYLSNEEENPSRNSIAVNSTLKRSARIKNKMIQKGVESNPCNTKSSSISKVANRRKVTNRRKKGKRRAASKQAKKQRKKTNLALTNRDIDNDEIVEDVNYTIGTSIEKLIKTESKNSATQTLLTWEIIELANDILQSGSVKTSDLNKEILDGSLFESEPSLNDSDIENTLQNVRKIVNSSDLNTEALIERLNQSIHKHEMILNNPNIDLDTKKALESVESGTNEEVVIESIESVPGGVEYFDFGELENEDLKNSIKNQNLIEYEKLQKQMILERKAHSIPNQEDKCKDFGKLVTERLCQLTEEKQEELMMKIYKVISDDNNDIK